MNAHAMNGIRGLTAQELDQVTGGAIFSEEPSMAASQFLIFGAVFAAALAGVLDWLFG